MISDADISAPASLIADPTRAAFLVALSDGQSLPASELARRAQVTASTASIQLAKLVEGGFLAVERNGRHRYYSLLDPEIAAALEALRELPDTQGEKVLLHQDLHADNVLAAQREPWLAIDPKPLAGERELGIAPVVRSRELGHSKRDVLRRFDRLTADLGLDRERARGWTIAQTVAWASDGDLHQTHVETARWLLEAR